MIGIFKKQVEANKYISKVGDVVKYPIPYNDILIDGVYNFKLYKVEKNRCVPIESEANNARIRPYTSNVKGTFSFRILEFDSTGSKQFAVFVDGEQIGKTFRKSANTLQEYISLIVEHYSKIQGWEVESIGNIIKFTQTDECLRCGKTVSIELGKYAKTNTNKPCITKTFVETLEVIGQTCYILKFKNFMAGNIIKLNGTNYVISEGETQDDLRTKIQGEDLYYCVPNTTTIDLDFELGNRKVTNTNKPKLLVTYDTSDDTYDYYIVNSYDVRAGNIFKINDTEIVVSESDTQTTVDAFFNAYSGKFRTEKGANIYQSTLAGFRIVPNTNSPIFTYEAAKHTPTQDMDKYSITICNDVVKGNRYYLNGLTYDARDGETSLDVAYNLYGANSDTFDYYIKSGATLDAYVNVGYFRDSNNLLKTRLNSSTVVCTNKKGLVLEFEAKRQGKYMGVFTNSYGQDVAYTTLFEVLSDVEGEEVKFSNNSDAYGIEFDTSEVFQIRLPIFLKDKVPFIVENISENTNGEIVRGKTVITNKRQFVTKAIETNLHEEIVKILKCDLVVINGKKYKFVGEYGVDQNRNGAKDLRVANGELTEQENTISNLLFY